jgi:hypothetical protein
MADDVSTTEPRGADRSSDERHRPAGLLSRVWDTTRPETGCHRHTMETITGQAQKWIYLRIGAKKINEGAEHVATLVGEIPAALSDLSEELSRR